MLVLEPGASYSTDQGYLDFARVLVIQEAKPCFCRAKSNIRFKRRYAFGGLDQYDGNLRPNGVFRPIFEARRTHNVTQGGGQGRQGKTPGLSDRQLHFEVRIDCRSMPPALAGEIAF